MSNPYLLRATGNQQTQDQDLVDLVSKRVQFKNNIWRQRSQVLENLSKQLNALINIYKESAGNKPLLPETKKYYYLSGRAHEAWNRLQAEKLYADFVKFSPIGMNFDRSDHILGGKVSEAHRIMRYRGGYQKAISEAKSDLIWGESWVQFGIKNDDAGNPVMPTYEHAPFSEIRGFYGETDVIRLVEYPINKYAAIYGKEMLDKVAPGNLVNPDDDGKDYSKSDLEESHEDQQDRIQVVFYYDPAIKLHAEIHGSNGYVFKLLEGNDYPFIGENGEAFAPFKQDLFYKGVGTDYFGWGVMDFIIPLASLDTTITNATAKQAVDAASPLQLLYSNDPDEMERLLDQWEADRSQGYNKPLVQKITQGVGAQAQVQSVDYGVNNQNMQVWDDTISKRIIEFTNIDFNSLTDPAPTLGQQQLKKLEADKMNLRVLLLNQEREIEFARNEIQFLKNGRTKFHNMEIEVRDEFTEEIKAETGEAPLASVKIGDILKDVEDINMQIEPRMEGALDDMSFLEIQTMQQNFALLAPGTRASTKAKARYFQKVQPDLDLEEEDFVTPAGQEVGVTNQGVGQQGGLTNELNNVAAGL